MAWNDPGNSPGKRDPWERKPRRGNSGGQSNLDELIKRLKKMLSPASGNRKGTGATIGLAALIALLLLWMSTGLYQVNAGQVAVITRFGKFQRIEQAGHSMHLPWPIEDAQLISIADDEHREQVRILTRDETFVDVVYAIRFRRADVVAYAFNVRDPDSTLDQLVQSSLREVFARETLATALNASHQATADRARHLIQTTLDACKTGIVINGVDVGDVRVPMEVKAAQDDVSKAQSESAAAIAHAHEYASDIIPKTQGEAVVEREKAEAYKSERIASATGEAERFLKLLPEYQRAPAVTRERLYLETMESIYANAKKVFVNTRGNNTINVPLEKLTTGGHDVTDPVLVPNASGAEGSKVNH